MGYFDGLTDAAFKTDQQGRKVFYPWGVLGKGYITRDEAHYQRLRSKIKWTYIISLPAIIIGQVLYGWKIAVLFAVMYTVWYLAMLTLWLSGLEISGEKITVAEARRNSARSHNRATLIFLTVVSVLFVIMGLLVALGGKVWLGLLTAVFFGGCGWMIFQMLRDKAKQRREGEG